MQPVSLMSFAMLDVMTAHVSTNVREPIRVRSERCYAVSAKRCMTTNTDPVRGRNTNTDTFDLVYRAHTPRASLEYSTPAASIATLSTTWPTNRVSFLCADRAR